MKIIKCLVCHFLTLLCCIGATGSKASEDPPGIIALYLESQDPKATSRSFQIRDIGSEELKKGWHEKEPLLDASQIQRIELAAREFNMRPTLSVNISFEKSAAVKTKDIQDDRRIIIYFDGEYRAIVPGKLLKDTVNRSTSLFVALPKMTKDQIKALEDRLQKREAPLDRLEERLQSEKLPMIGGLGVPRMERLMAAGKKSSLILTELIRRRHQPKPVAMAAYCLRKIDPDNGIDFTQELQYWKTIQPQNDETRMVWGELNRLIRKE